MRILAPAKINLGLDVLRRREDGYHELRMIMQTVDLYDVVEIEKGTAPSLPQGEDNIAVRAANLLIEEFGIREPVEIYLEKNIPMAAGLAGGSADAAAVLRGMNELFSLGLARKELMERGVKLGADVPYCILGGTALAEGIGEKLTVLPEMPDCFIVLGKPGIEVSTKFVYTNLKTDELESHPDIEAQIEALRKGDLVILAEKMGNVLETVTVQAHPVIEEIRQLLLENGALGARMSGSGPTVFGLFREKKRAERALQTLRESGLAKENFLARPAHKM